MRQPPNVLNAVSIKIDTTYNTDLVPIPMATTASITSTVSTNPIIIAVNMDRAFFVFLFIITKLINGSIKNAVEKNMQSTSILTEPKNLNCYNNPAL
jgi:LDH2 family malate/lactate/ureidoglycolate dehydrogenase